MTDTCCDICGDLLNDKCVIKLKCNHSFHYECVMKSFQCEKKKQNSCPLCRRSHGFLPVINGLTKVTKGIHYIDYKNIPQISNTPCCTALKSGKRKGEPCNAKCMLGMDHCKRHHLSTLKQSEKQKKSIKVNKLGDDLEQVQVEQLLEVTAIQPLTQPPLTQPPLTH
jgi:hypothetical protein